MFEVGFTEIVLILGIALLVLGPARLPKLAADVGRWAGKARAMARQLKSQLEQEASNLDPMHDTSRPSRPVHTPATTAPAAPAAAATDVPAAGQPAPDMTTTTPDATHESKPA